MATQKALTKEQATKSLGYNPIFAEREDLTAAMEYVIEVGKATGDSPSVVTATMIYANTLINLITDRFDLTPKQ